MAFHIARADANAAPEAQSLILEAADWLIAKGEPLWGMNETSYEDLLRVAHAGELVLGRIEGKAVACLYLHDEDPMFWPDAKPGEAFYVHRLAVARKHAGRGLSLAMLEWAEEETRCKGRRYLRLDCEPRPELLALYSRAGMTRIDAEPLCVIGHFVVRHEKLVAGAADGSVQKNPL